MPERRDDEPIPVVFDFLEAMGTLAALRAVIDSAPHTPDKLVSAERKLAAEMRTKTQP